MVIIHQDGAMISPNNTRYPDRNESNGHFEAAQDLKLTANRHVVGVLRGAVQVGDVATLETSAWIKNPNMRMFSKTVTGWWF